MSLKIVAKGGKMCLKTDAKGGKMCLKTDAKGGNLDMEKVATSIFCREESSYFQEKVLSNCDSLVR